MEKPIILNGDSVCDERGKVSFVNEFTFPEVKRFYLIQNHDDYFVRAWQGHQKEAKYFTVLQGRALIGVVKIDNWQNPSKHLPVEKFILSAEKPSLLCIPKGFANGIMNFSSETKILVYATSTLAETKLDDFRWEPLYWNPWSDYKPTNLIPKTNSNKER